MSVLERKAELVKSILNDINEEQLIELEKFYIKLTGSRPTPCAYSVEELKERVQKSIQQVDEGKVTSHEDMKKRHTA